MNRTNLQLCFFILVHCIIYLAFSLLKNKISFRPPISSNLCISMRLSLACKYSINWSYERTGEPSASFRFGNSLRKIKFLFASRQRARLLCKCTARNCCKRYILQSNVALEGAAGAFAAKPLKARNRSTVRQRRPGERR